MIGQVNKIAHYYSSELCLPMNLPLLFRSSYTWPAMGFGFSLRHPSFSPHNVPAIGKRRTTVGVVPLESFSANQTC